MVWPLSVDHPVERSARPGWKVLALKSSLACAQDDALFKQPGTFIDPYNEDHMAATPRCQLQTDQIHMDLHKFERGSSVECFPSETSEATAEPPVLWLHSQFEGRGPSILSHTLFNTFWFLGVSWRTRQDTWLGFVVPFLAAAN